MRRNPELIKGRWGRWVLYVLALAVGWPLLINAVNSARSDNGFDLSDSLIPADEIHHGGPTRDGIPALDNPTFIASDKADFMKPDDRVLGIELNGQRRAYPVLILNHHEIVNDHIGRDGVVITYCPLCGTGMAFSSLVDGELRRFGVSGLLYNSDVLLYDRESESLWSQLKRQAISGPLKGYRLTSIPMQHTTWADWQQGGPGLVLSKDTGHSRDYSRSPYGSYDDDEAIYFPVNARSARYHPKERVLGIGIEDVYRAYPFSELAQVDSPLRDVIDGKEIEIRFDAATRSGRIFDSSGQELTSVNSFWFAWYAFHPETTVYKPKKVKSKKAE